MEGARNEQDHGAQRRVDGVKFVVIGDRCGIVEQVSHQPDEGDEAGEEDAGAEDLTDQNFDLFVVQ